MLLLQREKKINNQKILTLLEMELAE